MKHANRFQVDPKNKIMNIENEHERSSLDFVVVICNFVQWKMCNFPYIVMWGKMSQWVSCPPQSGQPYTIMIMWLSCQRWTLLLSRPLWLQHSQLHHIHNHPNSDSLHLSHSLLTLLSPLTSLSGLVESRTNLREATCSRPLLQRSSQILCSDSRSWEIPSILFRSPALCFSKLE